MKRAKSAKSRASAPVDLHMFSPRTQVSGGVLTSTGSKNCQFTANVNNASTLTENGRSANEQHQQVSNAEVYQEDVRRVSHVFGLEDHNGNLWWL